MSKIIICDTETTGMSNDAKMVEFAAVLVLNGHFVEQHSFLINPEIPIPPEASAVHHLTEKDLEEALKYPEALTRITEIMSEADYLVAHNHAFDIKYLPKVDKPWICTMRVARHLIEGAPSYANQVLRYFLKLEPNLPHAMAPHRALYDTVITTELFLYLLELAGSCEEMVRLTQTPVLKKKMNFGKHKGKPIEEVDTAYLQWLKTADDLDEDMKSTINHHLKKRGVLR